MIGIGSYVALTELGVLYIREMFEDFQYENETFEVVGIDNEDDLYEVDINGHRFWMKVEEIVE